MGCRFCGHKTKRLGRTKKGSRRFKCLTCHKTFTWCKSKSSSSWSRFNLFYEFVTGEVNRKKILKTKHWSRPTLSKILSQFLDAPPPPQLVWEAMPPVLPSKWIYGVDGKWLRRLGVVLIHRNITTKETLFWSFHDNETYQAVFSDLFTLSPLLDDHLPTGAISDWKGAFVSGVKTFFGDIAHQRCLTHVDRTLKVLLPLGSPLVATQALRSIALDLIKIKDTVTANNWLWHLSVWESFYGYQLKERTISSGQTKKKWWYTHGNLRRAWRLLNQDQKALLAHLDDPFLPTSNNSLEGTISQASNKLINHRGMPLSHRFAFLAWYFAFSRVKNNDDLKKLWGYWKRR